jgi:release factor glutamine methyltransferase
VAKASHAEVTAQLRAAGCVFAEDEARVLLAHARTPDEAAELVARRMRGIPLEHVVGWAEFCGMRIAVTDGVFVPRRRTECLVAQAVRCAQSRAGERPVVVVDLCCGSGAVGAAIATGTQPVELHCSDIDARAVECARGNVGQLGRVYHGDLFEALPKDLHGRVGVLVANVPYVPSEAIALMPPEARVHEPRIALDGGADGLDVVRRLVAGAGAWLAPGGVMLVESSDLQVTDAVALFVQHGLRVAVVRDPELDATVVIGSRIAPPRLTSVLPHLASGRVRIRHRLNGD